MPTAWRRIFGVHNWTCGSFPIQSGCLLYGGLSLLCGRNRAISSFSLVNSHSLDSVRLAS